MDSTPGDVRSKVGFSQLGGFLMNGAPLKGAFRSPALCTPARLGEAWASIPARAGGESVCLRQAGASLQAREAGRYSVRSHDACWKAAAVPTVLAQLSSDRLCYSAVYFHILKEIIYKSEEKNRS